jgi:hypothetical protein
MAKDKRMTGRAFSQLRALSNCSGQAADAGADRRTLLFESRIPDFAQPAWLAVQRTLQAMDTSETKQDRSNQRGRYTYAVLEEERPVIILFFQIEKKRVTVLNEADQVTGAELQDFSRYVFRHFARVNCICFHAQRRYIHCPDLRGARNRASRFTLPTQASVRLEEATRFNRLSVTYFLQRLKRDHPGFGFECYADEAIQAVHCRTLLRMNHLQLVPGKEKEEPLDDASEEMIRAAQVAGLVCLLRIDGRIAAGVICRCVGGEWRISCLAYDPLLKAYGLGMLCLYFAACVHIDSLRKKAGATILRPRYTHALAVHQERVTVMTLRRPHASWLVRCDCAVHETAMGYLRWTRQMREECVQVGGAFIRLLSAWKQAFQSAKKRCSALLWRPSGRSAFLRGQ